jgi:hypothetical protein
MEQKIINLKTNYNNKLHCNCFPHIDLAPAAGVRESLIENTVFEIRTVDGSHPPVKTKLVTLIRIPLWKISDALSYPSHGIDSVSFQEKMVAENSFTHDKEMAVYFYQRLPG